MEIETDYTLPPHVDDDKEERLRELHEKRDEITERLCEGEEAMEELQEVNDEITEVMME